MPSNQLSIITNIRLMQAEFRTEKEIHILKL